MRQLNRRVQSAVIAQSGRIDWAAVSRYVQASEMPTFCDPSMSSTNGTAPTLAEADAVAEARFDERARAIRQRDAIHEQKCRRVLSGRKSLEPEPIQPCAAHIYMCQCRLLTDAAV